MYFDEWTHFAITRDSDLNYISIEMASFLVHFKATSLEFIYNPSPAIGELGYGPNGDEGYNTGNLDEIRFWNYARTPEQIQQNLYREVNANDPGLFVYYQFNENWNTQIEDKSGNGNSLNLNGGSIQKYTLDTWQSDFSSSVVDRDWYGPSEKVRVIAYATDNGKVEIFDYSIGTTAGSDDAVAWFSTDTSEAEILINNLSEGTQYYSNVRVYDGIGNKSETVSSNGFKVDRTPPDKGTVSNGPATPLIHQA